MTSQVTEVDAVWHWVTSKNLYLKHKAMRPMQILEHYDQQVVKCKGGWIIVPKKPTALSTKGEW